MQSKCGLVGDSYETLLGARDGKHSFLCEELQTQRTVPAQMRGLKCQSLSSYACTRGICVLHSHCMRPVAHGSSIERARPGGIG